MCIAIACGLMPAAARSVLKMVHALRSSANRGPAHSVVACATQERRGSRVRRVRAEYRQRGPAGPAAAAVCLSATRARLATAHPPPPRRSQTCVARYHSAHTRPSPLADVAGASPVPEQTWQAKPCTHSHAVACTRPCADAGARIHARRCTQTHARTACARAHTTPSTARGSSRELLTSSAARQAAQLVACTRTAEPHVQIGQVLVGPHWRCRSAATQRAACNVRLFSNM